MQIKLLGPLEASVGGRSVLPTAAKPRQLLVLLALRPGQVVPAATIVEELWSQDPPRTARTTVQTYVMRLRRLLSAAGGAGVAKELLATRYGGYALDIAADSVDVHEYDRLRAAGRRAGDAGDPESAARLLRAALDVWRGPALVDVAAGPVLRLEVTRLEESRLGAEEDRIEAELVAGRPHALLGDLAVLTARHPMNENLCAHHMVALARAGRRWQALEAFRALRSALAEELGVEPSHRLRELHLALLRGDVDAAHRESRVRTPRTERSDTANRADGPRVAISPHPRRPTRAGSP